MSEKYWVKSVVYVIKGNHDFVTGVINGFNKIYKIR